MGTSTHMGIWKVVLDICSPPKHLKGISVEEKKLEMVDGEEKEVYLNRILGRLLPPQSSSTTLLLPALYNFCDWSNFGQLPASEGISSSCHICE